MLTAAGDLSVSNLRVRSAISWLSKAIDQFEPAQTPMLCYRLPL
jgi:hypothetical protein